MPNEVEQINDTTFGLLLGEDLVEIGNIDAPEFEPHIMLPRWNGECFLTVKPAGDITEVEVMVEGDKVKSKYKAKQDGFELELESEFYATQTELKFWQEMSAFSSSDALSVELREENGTHILLINNQVWMRDCPEYNTIFEGEAQRGFGDVLIAGLGLGLIQKHLLANPLVNSVTTIELSSDVIEFAKQVSPSIIDPRHTIIQDDFFDYCQQTTNIFDYIYGDIWRGLSPGWQTVYNNFKVAAERILAAGGQIDGYGAQQYEEPNELRERFTRRVDSFEFETILNKKPGTNKIVLNIETQGLKFYYQPPLREQEKASGVFRPDNVVGSYAVYHATRTNIHRNNADAEKYKCGKAFHIYRPKVTDANGNWVWADLSLDEEAGTLTATIPQDFLDTAVYPVSTGTANFGYETVGTAGDMVICAGSGPLSYKFTLGEDGDGVSMSAYIGSFNDGIPTLHQMKLYDSSRNAVANGTTNEGGNVTADSWNSLNFGTPPALSAGDYYLSFWCNGAGPPYDKWANWKYDVGVANQGTPDTAETYSDWPATLPAAEEDFKFSIYCTYTPGGGPAAGVGGAGGLAAAAAALLT